MTLGHTTASPGTGPETIPIAQDVRDFYDPGKVFGGQHDPDDKALKAYILDTRANPIWLPQVGHVAGEELVVVELANAGQLDLDNPGTYAWLGLELGKDLIPLYSRSIRYAQEIAQAAVEGLYGLRDEIGPTADEMMIARGEGRLDVSRRNNILLGSGVLAAAIFRDHPWFDHTDYDELTFMEHGRTTAAITQASWDQRIGLNNLDRTLHASRSLLHDILGAKIRNGGQPFLSQGNLAVTPLVVKEYLRKMGVADVYSDEVSDDLLALTRSVGRNGLQPYEAYNLQVGRRAGAVPTRLACIRSRREYQKSQGMIADPDSTDFPTFATSIIQRGGIHATSDRRLRDDFLNMDGIGLDLKLFGGFIDKVSDEQIQEARSSSILSRVSDKDLLYAMRRHYNYTQFTY